jgi:hypothetical protein
MVDTRVMIGSRLIIIDLGMIDDSQRLIMIDSLVWLAGSVKLLAGIDEIKASIMNNEQQRKWGEHEQMGRGGQRWDAHHQRGCLPLKSLVLICQNLS